MDNKESLKWVKKKINKQMGKIVILSCANIVLALIGTGLSLLSKFAIDAAQGAAESTSHGQYVYYKQTVILMGLAIFGIILLRLFVRMYSQSLSVKVQAKLEMDMRSKLFNGIMKKEYKNITEYHSGELMNRLTSDIRIVTDGVTSIIPDILYCVFQFIGAFIVLVAFDWKFTVLFLIAGLFISSITILFRKKLKELHKEVQRTDGIVRSFFQEAIESQLVVKTFGVEDKFSKKGDELQKNNFDVKMKRRNISIFANTGFSFIFNSGYLLALVWCALKVCAKTMSYGTLTAILQLISQIQTPFVNITKIIPQYYSLIASAERIMEIEDIPEEKIKNSIGNRNEFYNKFRKASFENIKFNYGRETVIEEGNAVFEKGDFVAIRGISGIGKSTLIKMLLGVFKPSEGKINLYDDKGKAVEAGPSTRSLFSYVPQGNYLFSGTIRENITLIADAKEEKINEALKISDIYEFVEKLPDGLDTIIGENGTGLSEGQAQRIAIARAILSEAPVLIFDEATSALDEKTENRVLTNIKNMKDRTCIIITHKPAALAVCNKEFRIENKKLSNA